MIDLSIMKALVLDSRDGITISDYSLPDNPFIFVNPAYEKMTGYSFEESVGKNCWFLQGSNLDQEEYQIQLLREAIKNKISCIVTLKNYRKNGSMFWNELSLSPIINDAGEPRHFLGVQKDITNQVIMEEVLIEKYDELAFQKFALDEHAIVSIANYAGNITYVNDKLCEISGYSREELLGKNHNVIKSDEHSDAFFTDMWRTISSGHTWHGDIENTAKNGSHYWVKTTIVPTLNDKGRPYQYIGIRTEITERKQIEEKLKRIAYYDSLTELPNRVLLSDNLRNAMEQCQRSKKSLTVAFLDLDCFKVINDTHGHNLGDEVLIALSKYMKEALREGDTLARIGGDEFIAVMVDLEKIEDSEPILNRLLEATKKSVSLGDTEIQISASIGVTHYPQDDVDVDQLMRHADQAMYVAKLAGKNRYHIFDTEQANAFTARRQSIVDIGKALGRHEFLLYYQPKVNMHTGEVVGVEALIRWQHPERGIVPPLDFLPAIEGHAVSLTLGEWVINTALNQISQWQSFGLNLPISVNVSAYQLTQKNFSDRLRTLLADHPEVSPSSLELEILETSELSDISHVSEIMKACHKLGVSFALDDFGTGYSSLTYLRHLPAYLVKVDQSFVRDMLEDKDDLAIVEGVVVLARAFQRKVIAEGVETIAHGIELIKLGCLLGQGYGIARPMPAGDIPEWASSWIAHDSWLAADCHSLALD